MVSRLLGSIGRFFITTGIVILLFVAYQLWGTGLQEASAQSSLGSDFDALIGSVDGDELAAPITSTTSSAAPTTTEVAQTTTTTSTTTTTLPAAGGTIPVSDPDLANKLYREGGEAIARIEIPQIEVNKVIVEGVKVEDLRNGPGHYRSTVFPGQEGNSGVAGHRTTYGAPFNRIDELLPGDEFTVTTVQGEHTYRVMSAEEAYGAERLGSLSDFQVDGAQGDLGHIIVRPQDTWVLGDFGDNRLTLTACHPKFSARERIIVAAELVSVAVDAPPPPPDYSTVDEVELPTEELLSEATGEGLADGPDSLLNDDEPEAITIGDAVTGEVDAAAAIPVADLDEGLNGDKDALLPAIGWGLLAIAAYIFFKELSKRWRRWPSVALGIFPVIVFVGLSFEKIDRYLPAG